MTNSCIVNPLRFRANAFNTRVGMYRGLRKRLWNLCENIMFKIKCENVPAKTGLRGDAASLGRFFYGKDLSSLSWSIRFVRFQKGVANAF